MSRARNSAIDAANNVGGSTGRLLASAPVQLLCRLALGALFLYAALPKISDPAAFAKDIANYRMLPDGLVFATAVVLPWIELLAAVLVILGIGTRAAALLCTLLLLAFTAAIGTAVARGLDIECGCFGKSDEGRIGWGTVLRDGAFLLPALLVTFYDRGRYGLQSLWR